MIDPYKPVDTTAPLPRGVRQRLIVAWLRNKTPRRRICLLLCRNRRYRLTLPLIKRLGPVAYEWLRAELTEDALLTLAAFNEEGPFTIVILPGALGDATKKHIDEYLGRPYMRGRRGRLVLHCARVEIVLGPKHVRSLVALLRDEGAYDGPGVIWMDVAENLRTILDSAHTEAGLSLPSPLMGFRSGYSIGDPSVFASLQPLHHVVVVRLAAALTDNHRVNRPTPTLGHLRQLAAPPVRARSGCVLRRPVGAAG